MEKIKKISVDIALKTSSPTMEVGLYKEGKKYFIEVPSTQNKLEKWKHIKPAKLIKKCNLDPIVYQRILGNVGREKFNSKSQLILYLHKLQVGWISKTKAMVRNNIFTDEFIKNLSGTG